MIAEILQGDCLEVLKGMDSESIDMCITSPPYWGLRDYGAPGQLGLEPTYQEYIEKLLAIFEEVKRVLKDTGTCWVNLGDTYYNYRGVNNRRSDKDLSKRETLTKDHHNIDARPNEMVISGIEQKSLIGIPERFVIAMTDAGWIRRNTIIWHKPSCMPSSATDRFTVDFEYLYFFTKQKDYYFEQQLEKYTTPLNRYGGANFNEKENTKYEGMKTNYNRAGAASRPNENGRNKRCVWSINTQPYLGAHFATYPEELVAAPIQAGSPKGGTVLDPFMGSGTTLKVARDLGRKGVGIELNPEYIELARKRINLQQNIFTL
jgi:site-specific DNA-methyltransferase (adenine-specific)